jgi:hypothetical protein
MKEKRKHKRYKVNPQIVKAFIINPELTTTIMNMSETGISLRLNSIEEMNQIIDKNVYDINLNILEPYKSLDLKVEKKWIISDVLGAEFIDLSNNEKDAIKSVL